MRSLIRKTDRGIDAIEADDDRVGVEISLQATSALAATLLAEMPKAGGSPERSRQSWLEHYRKMSAHTSASGAERRLVDAYANLLAAALALHDEQMRRSSCAVARPALTVVGGTEHEVLNR